jgi:predicted negative regulator of RcsB-dependent stress response
MTTVNFMLISNGKTEEEAKDGMKKLVEKLTDLCQQNGLELCARYLINSGRLIQWEETDWQARYDLQIPKRKGITYNQIYKIVNSVQPNPFKIER